MVERIVSGGQTGVDRAALDVALALGIPHGGWVPKGRRAEDGVIPARYTGLRELDSTRYADRTRRNVEDSDATLILDIGPSTGGTELTIELARQLDHPLLIADLADDIDRSAAAAIRRWMADVTPAVLNVAGPRASTEPRIYDRAVAVLTRVLGARQPS